MQEAIFDRLGPSADAKSSAQEPIGAVSPSNARSMYDSYAVAPEREYTHLQARDAFMDSGFFWLGTFLNMRFTDPDEELTVSSNVPSLWKSRQCSQAKSEYSKSVIVAPELPNSGVSDLSVNISPGVSFLLGFDEPLPLIQSFFLSHSM